MVFVQQIVVIVIERVDGVVERIALVPQIFVQHRADRAIASSCRRLASPSKRLQLVAIAGQTLAHAPFDPHRVTPMIPAETTDDQDEEQIGGDADECRDERPVEHDVTQTGEMGHNLQGDCVELDVARLNLNEDITNGTCLCGRSNQIHDYRIIHNIMLTATKLSPDPRHSRGTAPPRCVAFPPARQTHTRDSAATSGWHGPATTCSAASPSGRSGPAIRYSRRACPRIP